MIYNIQHIAITKKKLTIFLFLYHLIITYFAFKFATNNITDANSYWFRTNKAYQILSHTPYPFREYLLYYINYILAVLLNLPFWFGFILYSVIGFFGIQMLCRSLPKMPTSHTWVVLYIIFLPSMHFWTSFIGKEPLVFLAISMIIYTLWKIKSNQFILIGFLILTLIRPHVAIILAFSIAIAYTIIKRKIHLGLVVGFLLMSILSLNILLKSHWLAGFSIENFELLFQTHHEAFKKTHTYVPLEDYNILYKIFTFYFRPFPFEFNTLFGWLMGIENIISLGITIVGVYALFQLIVKFQYKPSMAEISIIIFFILLAAVLSLAYSNYGLISRMKNQSQPFMLLLCLHWIGLYRNKRIA